MRSYFSFKQAVRLAACFLAAALLSACHDGHQQKEPPPVPVKAVEIKQQYIPLYKTYIGVSQSIASVGIRARVKGFLIKKNFTEGKPVKEGQLLFEIDPRPFKAALDQAKGNLARAIANRDFQNLEYLRYKKLVDKGNISVERYDRSATQLKEAEAQIQIEQANVEQAELNLNYCYMYSPFDGVIGEKLVDVGNLVGGTEDTLLATVVQFQPIYVQFSPSIQDYGEFLKYLKERQEKPFNVRASIPQDDKLALTGKLDLINNQADVQTATVLMRATVDNMKPPVLPGIYLNVRVELNDKEPALLVPATAISDVQGMRSVMKINKEGRVVIQTVESKGEFGQQVIIGKGLQSGDKVIIEGQQKLRPGVKVAPEFVKDASGHD